MPRSSTSRSSNPRSRRSAGRSTPSSGGQSGSSSRRHLSHQPEGRARPIPETVTMTCYADYRDTKFGIRLIFGLDDGGPNVYAPDLLEVEYPENPNGACTFKLKDQSDPALTLPRLIIKTARKPSAKTVSVDVDGDEFDSNESLDIIHDTYDTHGVPMMETLDSAGLTKFGSIFLPRIEPICPGTAVFSTIFISGGAEIEGNVSEANNRLETGRRVTCLYRWIPSEQEKEEDLSRLDLRSEAVDVPLTTMARLLDVIAKGIKGE